MLIIELQSFSLLLFLVVISLHLSKIKKEEEEEEKEKEANNAMWYCQHHITYPDKDVNDFKGRVCNTTIPFWEGE
jgi:hypothetical protein